MFIVITVIYLCPVWANLSTTRDSHATEGCNVIMAHLFCEYLWLLCQVIRIRFRTLDLKKKVKKTIVSKLGLLRCSYF